MEIKLNTRLLWQPRQPLASHFPGDVSTDVGLCPWAFSLAQTDHHLWNYMCSSGKQSRLFQDKTCWASHSEWLRLLWCKVHTQASHYWRCNFHRRLTISLPRRKGWIYHLLYSQDDTMSACTVTPKTKGQQERTRKLPEATGFNSCHLEMPAQMFQRIISKT